MIGKRLDGFAEQVGTVWRVRQRDHLVLEVKQAPSDVLT